MKLAIFRRLNSFWNWCRGAKLSQQQIGDDEKVCRRIPPSEQWFEPPNITSANFKLDTRINEQGVSVYRLSVVTAEQVLKKPGAIPGSFIVAATVGQIRLLKNGQGDPLNLDVVAVDDAYNPGHSEIRGPTPGKLSNAASRSLQRLFQQSLTSSEST